MNRDIEFWPKKWAHIASVASATKARPSSDRFVLMLESVRGVRVGVDEKYCRTADLLPPELPDCFVDGLAYFAAPIGLHAVRFPCEGLCEVHVNH